MKSKGIALLLSVFCFVTLSAQSNLYNRFSEKEEVASVHIPKSMFQLISVMGLKTNDLDISKISSKLDVVYILTTENRSIAQDMKKAVTSERDGGRYEQVMHLKDKGQNILIYAKPDSNSQIREMIMLTDEDKRLVLVQLVGNLSVEDIQGILKK